MQIGHVDTLAWTAGRKRLKVAERSARTAVWTLGLILLSGLLSGTPASATPNRPPVGVSINLVNVATGRCADLPGNGIAPVNEVGVPTFRPDPPVTQYDCRYTNDNQRWRLEPHGTSWGLPAYLIKNDRGGCMDLPYFRKVGKGSPVSLYACRPNDDNQLFVAFSQAPGVFKLGHALDPSLCLDVAGTRSKANDARLTLWPCNSKHDDHFWQFRTTAPPTKAASSRRPGGARVDTAPGVLLRMRSAPDLTAPVIRRLRNGTPLDVKCSTLDDGGRTWLRTRLGFVAAKYVRGEPASLPDCGEGRPAPLPATPTSPSSAPPPAEATYANALKFITDEITENYPVAAAQWEACQKIGNGVGSEGCRYTYWVNQVRPGGPWDHKPKIGRWFCYGSEKNPTACAIRSSDKYMPVPGTAYAVRFDIWSNIHYGYVGRAIGLGGFRLQRGADLTDGVAGRNDAGDRRAIQIGIDLQSRTPAHALTKKDVDSAIRGELEELTKLEGNPAIRRSDCRPTAVSPCEAPRDLSYLLPGERLDRDHPILELRSPGALPDSPPTHRLVMEGNGDLVLYQVHIDNTQRRCAASSTTTAGPGAYARYQEDGNFVVYRADGRTAGWASNTEGRKASRVTLERPHGQLVVSGKRLPGARC